MIAYIRTHASLTSQKGIYNQEEDQEADGDQAEVLILLEATQEEEDPRFTEIEL